MKFRQNIHILLYLSYHDHWKIIELFNYEIITLIILFLSQS